MRSRLPRYAAAGGTAAIVDIGGFTLFAALGVPIVVAATGSFLGATVVNFLLSSRWVFYAQATLARYAAFLFGALFSLLANVLVTSLCAIYLGFPHGASKAIAVGTTFLFSYWINQRFVFRRNSNSSASESSR